MRVGDPDRAGSLASAPSSRSEHIVVNVERINS
jgi:hypothetical protein